MIATSTKLTPPVFASAPAPDEFRAACRKSYGLPLAIRDTPGLKEFTQQTAEAQAAAEWEAGRIEDDGRMVRATFSSLENYIAARKRELMGTLNFK